MQDWISIFTAKHTSSTNFEINSDRTQIRRVQKTAIGEFILRQLSLGYWLHKRTSPSSILLVREPVENPVKTHSPKMANFFGPTFNFKFFFNKPFLSDN